MLQRPGLSARLELRDGVGGKAVAGERGGVRYGRRRGQRHAMSLPRETPTIA